MKFTTALASLALASGALAAPLTAAEIEERSTASSAFIATPVFGCLLPFQAQVRPSTNNGLMPGRLDPRHQATETISYHARMMLIDLLRLEHRQRLQLPPRQPKGRQLRRHCQRPFRE